NYSISQSLNSAITQSVLLTHPAIASEAQPRYPANSENIARTHDQSFRIAPVHCCGRPHPRWQEHAGAHPGRAAECATGDGTRGESVSWLILRRRARGGVSGAVYISGAGFRAVAGARSGCAIAE